MLPEITLEMPKRDGGRLQWHSRHLEAARLHARNTRISWAEVADRIGVAFGTARNYTSIPGFQELIRYYVAVERQKEYEALAAQKYELIMNGENAAFVTLLEATKDPDVDIRVRVDAAFKLLRAMGVVSKNEAIGKAAADQLVATRRVEAVVEDDDAEYWDVDVEAPK